MSVGHTANREWLKRVTRQVCKAYKIPEVPLRFVNDPKNPEFGWTEYEYASKTWARIFLNRGYNGQNLMTLLHELAHCVVDGLYDDAQDHGPEFCAIYMYLLNRYKLVPMDCFRLMASRWKIRIDYEYLPSAFD